MRSSAAVASGAIGMVCVGTSVSVSHTLTGGPLFTAQAIRYTAAFALLLGLARVRGTAVLRPSGREWLWLAGVAASGLVLFNVAVVRGVAHAEPAVIAVAVACVPVLLAVIGALMSGRTPSGGALLAAVVVTLGGVLVIGTGRADAAGVGWAVVALACEAGFTLFAVPVLDRLGAWGVSLWSVALAAAMLVALGLASEGPGAAGRLTGTQWGAIAHLTVVVTATAFVLWYSAVGALGPGPAGLLTGIAPVSAAVAGIALGSGAPGVTVWAGIGVVVGGLAVGLWFHGHRTNKPEPNRTAEPHTPEPITTSPTG